MRFQSGQGRALRLALFVLVTGGAAWAFLSPRETDPETVWRQGEADFLAGRYAETETALQRLRRLRTATPPDLMLRAQLAMARNHDDEAIESLAKIPDSDPLASQARFLSGHLELKRNRLSKAETYLRDATRLDPKLVSAHRELIYIYGMLSRRALLNAEFRALSDLTVLTFENIWHWCLTRNTIWEPVEQRQHLTKFLHADPDDQWTRLALAECLRQLQLPEEAEKTLAALADSDPDARVIRARIALDRGREDDAERLLSGGPADHPDLNRLRGRMALARQKNEEALQYFRAAHAAEPDNRDTLFGLASALNALGKTAEAEPYMTSSRNYDLLGTLVQKASTAAGQNDPKMLGKLAVACEAVGRHPEARACYKLMIARNPLDGEAQRALFRLDVRRKKKEEIMIFSGDM